MEHFTNDKKPLSWPSASTFQKSYWKTGLLKIFRIAFRILSHNSHGSFINDKFWLGHD